MALRWSFFGKWHLGDEVFAQRGFQNWISTEDQYWKHYSQKRNIDTYSTYHDWLTNNQGKYPNSGDRFSRTETANLPKEFTKIDYLAEQAERFIQESAEEPFILYIGFLEPHPPYTGPFNDFRSEIPVPLPANFNDLCGPERHPKNRLQAEYYRYFGGEAAEDLDLNTTKGWEDILRRYHGMCHHIDLGVGRIIAALQKAGIYDNTMIVYTSDHGDQMGSHGILEKGVMFEESLKIPLIVKEPGQKKGNVVSRGVSQIDLIPAILENLGQAVPKHLHGEILPRFDGEGESEPVIVEWNKETSLENDPWVDRCVEAVSNIADVDRVREVWSDRIRTIIRPDGWKYSWSEKGWDELFHLNTDPFETRNRVTDQSLTDLVSSSRQLIQNWQDRTDDPDREHFIAT
jgi:arylsulfatase A-like enzyme